MSLAISKTTFPKVVQQDQGLRPVAPFLHQTSQKRSPSREREELLPAGLCFATFFRYSHSMASVLLPRHPSCTQSSASARNACRRVTRRRVSSASGTEAGTASKTHLKLRALSFRFAPKGTADGLCGLDSAENARFETQAPFCLLTASCNRK